MADPPFAVKGIDHIVLRVRALPGALVFYRDVLSRDLHGLATRSDGRLVWGPVLTDLSGKAPSERAA